MFYLAYCSLPSGIPSVTDVKIEINAAMQAVDNAVIQLTSLIIAVVPTAANRAWQNVLSALDIMPFKNGLFIKLFNIFYPHFPVDP